MSLAQKRGEIGIAHQFALTDEGATALNIYLHNMVNATKKEGKATLPANSYLIKAIKQGHIFPEDVILLSLSANNTASHQNEASDAVRILNGAMPSSVRATDPSRSHVVLEGDVSIHTPLALDEAMFVVGGSAVALKIVELASSPEELQSAVSLLVESLRENWKASEEIERMREWKSPFSPFANHNG